MIKKLLTALIIFPFVQLAGQNLNHQFITVQAELTQNTAIDLHQDHNGFLWIGTRNGLNRYDGINMKSYQYDEFDSTSLSSSFVGSIFEDSDHNLWIGTIGGGVCKYNEETDSFVRLNSSIKKNILGERVWAIFEDHNKLLWIGTETNGLYSYNRENGELLSYRKNIDDPFAISNNYVTDILEDNENNLWVATSGGGLNLFESGSGRFIHFRSDSSDSRALVSDRIWDLHKGPTGQVWCATQKGLDRLAYDNRRSEYFFEHQGLGSFENKTSVAITTVLEDSKNRLWAGTENKGLYFMDLQTMSGAHYVSDSRNDFTLKNNSLWDLIEDKRGVVWGGTFCKGVFKIDKQSKNFQHYKHIPQNENSLSGNIVSTFVENSNGNVWVGTDGGGLNLWNLKEGNFITYDQQSTNNQIASNAIMSLLMDRHENLWIGTWGGGVSLLRKGSKQFERFQIIHEKNQSPGEEYIYSIIEDTQGRIWFGTYGNGVYIYNSEDNIFKGLFHDEFEQNSISSDKIRCLFQDINGYIWIGTNDAGLNKLKESNGKFQIERYIYNKGKNGTISNNIITSIASGLDGKVWVGTFSGLNSYNSMTNDFETFGKVNGFPNETIYAIQPDENNNLWLSSNQGLFKFDLNTGRTQNYVSEDGLQGMEFYKNSSYRLASGEFLFGGIDGFNKFSPNEIAKDNFEPLLYLSEFKISNQTILPGPTSVLKKVIRKTDMIKLAHDQNDFSFEFSVLSFSQTTKNEYAYQLINYDDDWQEIGNRREAFFANVPPGSYVFKVKGTNSDGLWSRHVTSVKVEIARPWYYSYWAYFIYGCILLGIMFGSIRILLNKERLKAQLHVEHIALSKMQELDEMKSRFFTNISHEFRSPLTLIIGPLRTMWENEPVASKKQRIGIMIRNAEILLSLINQLLELSKVESGKMKLECVNGDIVEFLKPILYSFFPLADSKEISYKITIPQGQKFVCFDPDKLEKIVLNLLANAFNYTGDYGTVKFEIKEEEEFVELIVEDDGIGIPEDEVNSIFNRYYRVYDSENNKSKGTGIGLALTKELVELHNGEIELESVENQGTVFKVRVKKGIDHLKGDEIVPKEQSKYFEDRALLSTNVHEPIEVEEISNGEDQENAPFILIIEDKDEIRTYIKQILEMEYSILESSNGIKGFELASERIPDLIISDIMMPKMDGITFCEKIKSDIKTSHIPVILLTAKASDESALKGFEGGADYYITKPFNPRLLSLQVRNALSFRDQIREQVLNTGSLILEPTNVQLNSCDEDFIKKAVRIVEDNMSNSEFYVEDLGKELVLSRMQLYRKLKGLIGLSANEFVRTIRLKRAAQLIRQSEMTISEITYQVGFNDLQYFRDCFKKQYGKNPSDYNTAKKEDIEQTHIDDYSTSSQIG